MISLVLLIIIGYVSRPKHKSSTSRLSQSPNHEKSRSTRRSKSRDRSRRSSPHSKGNYSPAQTSRRSNVTYATSLLAEVSKTKKAREKLEKIETEKRRQQRQKEMEEQTNKSKNSEPSGQRESRNHDIKIPVETPHHIPLPPSDSANNRSVIKRSPHEIVDNYVHTTSSSKNSNGRSKDVGDFKENIVVTVKVDRDKTVQEERKVQAETNFETDNRGHYERGEPHVRKDVYERPSPRHR